MFTLTQHWQWYLVIHQSAMIPAAVVTVTLTDPARKACELLDIVDPLLLWFCSVKLGTQPGGALFMLGRYLTTELHLQPQASWLS